MTEQRATPDVDDDSGDVPPPLVRDEPNRYAIPLTTLVGGAYVGVTEQVTLHDEPEVPQAWSGGPVHGGGGGDGDGD